MKRLEALNRQFDDVKRQEKAINQDIMSDATKRQMEEILELIMKPESQDQGGRINHYGGDVWR